VDEGKAEMKSLDARRKELEAQLITADEPPPLLHPGMARMYRSKVSQLPESWNNRRAAGKARDAFARSCGGYRADS